MTSCPSHFRVVMSPTLFMAKMRTNLHAELQQKQLELKINGKSRNTYISAQGEEDTDLLIKLAHTPVVVVGFVDTKLNFHFLLLLFLSFLLPTMCNAIAQTSLQKRPAVIVAFQYSSQDNNKDDDEEMLDQPQQQQSNEEHHHKRSYSPPSLIGERQQQQQESVAAPVCAMTTHHQYYPPNEGCPTADAAAATTTTSTSTTSTAAMTVETNNTGSTTAMLMVNDQDDDNDNDRVTVSLIQLISWLDEWAERRSYPPCSILHIQICEDHDASTILSMFSTSLQRYTRQCPGRIPYLALTLHPHFTRDQAKVLSMAIRRCVRLRTVQLDFNGAKQAHALLLVAAAMGNPSVRSLLLDGNGLTDTAVHWMASILQAKYNLQHQQPHNNKMYRNNNNHTLKHISLCHNPISPMAFAKHAMIWKPIKIRLRCCGNSFTSSSSSASQQQEQAA